MLFREEQELFEGLFFTWTEGEWYNITVIPTKTGGLLL